MRLFLLALFVVLCAVPASAQTVTAKLQWTTTDTAANAQSYAYTLKVGTTVVPMGAVTCAGTPTSCTAPLTVPLTPGSYTLTASNAFGSATSDPLVGAAPGKPTITIVVTVSAGED